MRVVGCFEQLKINLPHQQSVARSQDELVELCLKRCVEDHDQISFDETSGNGVATLLHFHDATVHFPVSSRGNDALRNMEEGICDVRLMNEHESRRVER